jgi:hypothetical protein
MDKLVRAGLAGVCLGLILAGNAWADCGCHAAAPCQDCDNGPAWHHGPPVNHCGESYCSCKSKRRHCWGGHGIWTDADACCMPKAQVECVKEADCGCYRHPYEGCFNGSSLLCDTGCSTYLPCKRVCVGCVTKCAEHTSRCGCGDCQADYSVTQECSAVERPRVVPWWFTGGQGNLYLDAGTPAPEMVEDQAGGTRLKGAAGSPEKKAAETPPASDAAGNGSPAETAPDTK